LNSLDDIFIENSVQQTPLVQFLLRKKEEKWRKLIEKKHQRDEKILEKKKNQREEMILEKRKNQRDDKILDKKKIQRDEERRRRRAERV